MSTALFIRERNPDDNFVLHGGPPLYTERRSFYPTNSDITTTTKKLSQHDYRAELYRDVLQDDPDLRLSLRSMAHSLKLVSDDIQKNLEDGGNSRRNYLQSRHGRLTFREDGDTDQRHVSTAPTHNARRWLADSEWNTSSGHHVAYEDDMRRTTLLNRAPSHSSLAGQQQQYNTATNNTITNDTTDNIFLTTTNPSILSTMATMSPTASLSQEDNTREAERLRRTVNTDMDLAQVPMTRFTRKDLMASEFFPVTMSYKGPEEFDEGGFGTRRSRSRTRSRDRLSQSARMRALTPERGPVPMSPVTDNYRHMKRLEKLYLITSEAPSTASTPHAVVSPYTQEIGQLRMQRLRLEEEHLKELNRLTTLERVRGPKPKWYELKNSQFHFEAGKNNELLRTKDRWDAQLRSSSRELSQSQPDLSTLRMRSASFS